MRRPFLYGAATMAQAKREPAGYERLIAALRASADADRAVQEKRYQKSSWEHWGVAVPNMDAAVRATVADIGQADALALATRLWGELVWDLKIVAARVLARKAVAPDADVWTFVTQRMGDLDGWAVADNLAVVGGRCLLADPSRLDFVDSVGRQPAFVDAPRGAGLHPAVDQGDSAIPSACSAGRRVWRAIANGSFRRRSAGGCANCRSAIRRACAAFSTRTARR